MPEEHAHKLVGPVSEFFLFTLAAQAMTLPIMTYHFGGVSWITLLANPLILPPQTLVMVLSGLAVLAGLVLPGLGQMLAVVSLPFVRYTIRTVTWLARLPGSTLLIPDFNVLWLVVFYALLIFVTLLPIEARKAAVKKVASPQAGLLVLTGLAVLVWSRALSAPDGRLHMTLIDGQGTVMVQSPSGQSVLIGGGASASSLNQFLGERLPAGDQRFDLLIVGSTAREDLLGLTGVIKKFPINAVLWGGDPETNQTSRTVYALLAERGVPVQTLASGSSLDGGDGLRIEILWVGERGAVLWLTWENFSALVPTGKVGDHWLDLPAPPAVLILPDGLAAQDLPLAQINLWAPAVILLPLESADLPLAGVHPIIEQLADYPVLSSHMHGWARVSTDGQQVWVSTQR